MNKFFSWNISDGLPLVFTSTFRRYYWEDILVILVTLFRSSQRLNAGLKLVKEKLAQVVKSV